MKTEGSAEGTDFVHRNKTTCGEASLRNGPWSGCTVPTAPPSPWIDGGAARAVATPASYVVRRVRWGLMGCDLGRKSRHSVRREKPTRRSPVQRCAGLSAWAAPTAWAAQPKLECSAIDQHWARCNTYVRLTLAAHLPQPTGSLTHGRQRLVARGAREPRISTKGGRARAADHGPQALRFPGRAPRDGVRAARPHATTVGAGADLAQGRAATGAAATGAAGAAAAGAAGAAAAGARRAAERDGPDRAAGSPRLPARTNHLGPAQRADDQGRLSARLSPRRDVPGPGARVAARTSPSSNDIV